MRGCFTALAAALALLVPTGASGGTAASIHAPILGVVPHANASHSSNLSTLAAAGPDDLFLQESPCALSSFPYPCWTMRTNTTYALYWIPSGFSVDANYRTLIDQYFHDVAAASGSQTNVFSVATQYYDNSAAVHYQSTFAGSYVDTDPFPPNGCTATAVCLTDEQIQAEIRHVLSVKGWQPGPDTTFFVMTPEGVGSCMDNVTDQCTTTTYCAYHSGFFDASHDPVIYVNEPYDADISGCWKGISPNHDAADATINTISHEQSEAITDPAGDAWLNSAGLEIGDICAWRFGPPLGGTGSDVFNQLINGHKYWLQEEYSNDGSSCLQRYTPTTAPSTVAPPVLAGAPGESQLLSTSEGSWKHAPSGYAFRWQRCAANRTGCVDISGATAAAYRLTSADVGHTVRAEVSAHNAAGASAGSVSSAPTPVVVPVPNATAQPLVSGVAAVHRKLSTTTGAWNTTVTVDYQWLRCSAVGSSCVAIPNATAATYVAAPGDAGHMLEARVSATNAAGTAVAVSNRTGVVAAVAAPETTKTPRISGRSRVGAEVTASTGSWLGPPTAYLYQWLRCDGRGGACKRVRDATQPTYRLRQRDAGHRMRVRITAVNSAGKTAATSAATKRVSARRTH